MCVSHLLEDERLSLLLDAARYLETSLALTRKHLNVVGRQRHQSRLLTRSLEAFVQTALQNSVYDVPQLAHRRQTILLHILQAEPHETEPTFASRADHRKIMEDCLLAKKEAA